MISLNILGAITFISLFCKVVLHIFLDYKSKNWSNINQFFLSGNSPLEYFFIYFHDVNKKIRIIKIICNVLYCIFILSTILFLVVFQSSLTQK